MFDLLLYFLIDYKKNTQFYAKYKQNSSYKIFKSLRGLVESLDRVFKLKINNKIKSTKIIFKIGTKIMLLIVESIIIRQGLVYLKCH